MDTGVPTDVGDLDMFWANAELVSCTVDDEPGRDAVKKVVDS